MRPLRSIPLFLAVVGLFVSCQKENNTANYTPSPSLYNPGGPTGPGISGQVSALCIYNGNLIVGGSFNEAGSISVNNIAQWNGSTWSSVGAGLSGTVETMTLYNNNLIVGGNFTKSGSSIVNNIAMWNGSSWQALGSGFNASVNALLVYNGNLIAAGSFGIAGGSTANYIAQWNGSTWSPIGSSFNAGSTINALALYNGNLVAAGTNIITQWNGSIWAAVGKGINSINCLATYNGSLYAGGTFIDDSIYYLAQWNGSIWSAVGDATIGKGTTPLTQPIVLTLNNNNNNLVVGGRFYGLGTTWVSSLAQWNDSTWTTPFGANIEYYPPGFDGPVTIDCSTTYNGNLIIGGEFTSVTSTLGASNIAQWDGSKWSAL